MRVLVISPVPTHPVSAGNRARVANLFSALQAAGHEVHLAVVPLEEGDAVATRNFCQGRASWLIYRWPWVRRSRLLRAARRVGRALGLARAYCWGVDDWYDPGVSAQLARLQAQHRFEAVLVEYVFMSRALEVFGAEVVKVIDTHDRFGNRHLDYLAAGKQPEWFATTPEQERRGLARADVVLAIQEGEAQYFKDLLGGTTRVSTLGHWLDLSVAQPPSTAMSAVFVGSGNSINADAVRYFVAQVLPLVRQRLPAFELVLAGDVCAAVADQPGLRKLGRVPAVAQAYAQARVAINPVRMGTGLAIKSVETLAFGVPMVASRTGARGLEALEGRALAVVPDDDAPAMAQALLGLLEDEGRYLAFRTAALQAARDWNERQALRLQEALHGA